MSEIKSYTPIGVYDPANNLVRFGAQQVRFLGSVTVVQAMGQTQITIGGGSSINVESNGVPVGVTGTLNFLGSNISVVDNAGVIEITVSNNPIVGNPNAVAFFNSLNDLDSNANFVYDPTNQTLVLGSLPVFGGLAGATVIVGTVTTVTSGNQVLVVGAVNNLTNVFQSIVSGQGLDFPGTGTMDQSVLCASFLSSINLGAGGQLTRCFMALSPQSVSVTGATVGDMFSIGSQTISTSNITPMGSGSIYVIGSTNSLENMVNCQGIHIFGTNNSLGAERTHTEIMVIGYNHTLNSDATTYMAIGFNSIYNVDNAISVGYSTLATENAQEVKKLNGSTSFKIINLNSEAPLIGSNFTITPNNSCVKLSSATPESSSAVTAITDGDFDGQTLKLLNIGAGTLTLIHNANIKLNGGVNVGITQFSTISFIWEATTGFWLETSRSIV